MKIFVVGWVGFKEMGDWRKVRNRKEEFWQGKDRKEVKTISRSFSELARPSTGPYAYR